MGKVLDSGFVELIDYMGDDNAVVDAARVSYNRSSDNFTPEQNNKLLNYLVSHDPPHMSPFEMVEYKFRIRAPVLVWWQWVRHRTFSYNFKSGRYTKYVADDMYLPGLLREQDKDNKQKSVERKQNDRDWMFLERLKNHYHRGIELYNELLASGIAKEQARLALPGFAMYHTAIVKADLRNLWNFLIQRAHPDAQYEIREYAKEILSIIETVHPNIIRVLRARSPLLGL